MSDEAVFEVGRNLAITPGDVVFENELIQLIQYRATTRQMYSRALLIVPPFINKYYILDLQAHNSFVRYCVDQGITTFVVSWRNIPKELGHQRGHLLNTQQWRRSCRLQFLGGLTCHQPFQDRLVDERKGPTVTNPLDCVVWF